MDSMPEQNPSSITVDELTLKMAAAVQRLEESRDRLILAQTRMEMAAERAEFAFASLGAASDQLGAALRDAELD